MKVSEMTIEQVTAEEISVVQDIVALQPYYNHCKDVPPAMKELSDRRKELRRQWKILKGRK